MDKIWYRNPSKSEVIGLCGGDENTEWPRRTDKSRTLKNPKNNKQIRHEIAWKLLNVRNYVVNIAIWFLEKKHHNNMEEKL